MTLKRTHLPLVLAVLILVLLLPVHGEAQTESDFETLPAGAIPANGQSISSQSSAPSDERKTEIHREASQERSPNRPDKNIPELSLLSRTLSPAPGIDPDLVERVTDRLTAGPPTVHLIALLDTFPTSEQWSAWARSGVHRVTYLHGQAWIVRFDLQPTASSRALLEDLQDRLSAAALVLLQPEDKTHPEFLAKADAGGVSRIDPRRRPQPDSSEPKPGRTARAVPEEEAPGFEEQRRIDPGEKAIDPEDRVKRFPVTLEIVVTLSPGTEPAAAADIVERFHRGRSSAEELEDDVWSLRIAPAHLRRLLAVEAVIFVEEGPIHEEPLMDRVRQLTRADALHLIDTTTTPPDYGGWTGNGVRVSNGEGLIPDHDDFWHHDASGSRTVPRWIDCEQGTFHGAMTAGIMFGGGFRSALHGGAPYAYRGMAPGTRLDCYHHEPDVSNHSFTQGTGDYNSFSRATDRKIRGDGSANFHPAVGAVANQGLTSQYPPEVGYYSVYRNAKNEIVVANLSAVDLQWNGSSLGPTWDGRIKPDLATPGSGLIFPRGPSEIIVDLEFVEISGGNHPVRWAFDAAGPAWHGGWGEAPWWGRLNLSIERLQASNALRARLEAPPWGKGFANRPLLGTLTSPDGSTFQVTGDPNDTLSIRYRVTSLPTWSTMPVDLQWASDPALYEHDDLKFEMIPDGQWHTASVPLGNHPQWAGRANITYVYLRFPGHAPRVPSEGQDYGGASGSSAAAPVVTGAIAQLLEQLVDELGVVLGDHSPSPFWTAAPASGVPLASTWKALLVHTARDLAGMNRPGEAVNPDTGAPTVYHDGPDLATGYGLIDVEKASRLLDHEAQAIADGEPRRMIESILDAGGGRIFNVEVEPGRTRPLKVTLAWDDAPGATHTAVTIPRLVNDLDLVLQAPDDTFHHPWTIDLPYEPTDPKQTPDEAEPEPIGPEDIRPARRDRSNHRDNLEQVTVEFPQAGTWRVLVLAAGLGAPPQPFSLLLDGPDPPPSSRLTGGRVAFTSDRVNPTQIFVQEVDGPNPPQQLTTDHFGAQHPAWSPDGRYLAYVTEDIVCCGNNNRVHVVRIVNDAGQPAWSFHAPQWFNTDRAQYPAWSPDGRAIVLTTFDSWGERGLHLLRFSTPYDFASATAIELVARGQAPGALDPADAEFSPDGRFVYFSGSSNTVASGLFRVPAEGGEHHRIYGNGVPLHRAYQLSVAPDGQSILYNSELWREDPVHYLDEELLEINLGTGIAVRRSHQPGHQYGWFAVNGSGEYAMQSSPAAGAAYDVYLVDGEERRRLDIDDPTNAFNEASPSWWKP